MQYKPQYAEPSYQAPWQGINVQEPEILMAPAAVPKCSNFIFRNGEIVSAPRFKKLTIPHPESPTPVRGLSSFVDNNNVAHTVAITARQLFQLNRIYGRIPTEYVWKGVDSYAGADVPIQPLVFLNKVYWTAATPGLWSWDGIKSSVTKESDYGAYFFGQLGFHLILLNTVEPDAQDGTFNYTQRVRWSATGLPNVWEPSANPNAGYNDQLDVPDGITGWLSIGNSGFIFRNNGITKMVLTGNGLKPFDFYHLWGSDKGVGSIYPQTVAGYGSVGMFISSEEIYKVTQNSFENVGGKARDAILSDLADATEVPTASIIPNLNRKFQYLTYQLAIPTKGDTKLWIYHIEDGNWTQRFLSEVIISSRMRMVATR